LGGKPSPKLCRRSRSVAAFRNRGEDRRITRNQVSVVAQLASFHSIHCWNWTESRIVSTAAAAGLRALILLVLSTSFDQYGDRTSVELVGFGFNAQEAPETRFFPSKRHQRGSTHSSNARQASNWKIYLPIQRQSIEPESS
jgi:hypothetical protein